MPGPATGQLSDNVLFCAQSPKKEAEGLIWTLCSANLGTIWPLSGCFQAVISRNMGNYFCLELFFSSNRCCWRALQWLRWEWLRWGRGQGASWAIWRASGLREDFFEEAAEKIFSTDTECEQAGAILQQETVGNNNSYRCLVLLKPGLFCWNSFSRKHHLGVSFSQLQASPSQCH